MFSIIRCCCCCCCHDCCNHLWPTCSDHSRILRPGNGFVSVSAGFLCHLQQHPTSSDQVPLDSATTSDVFANVSYVLRFLVFLQHFLLLSCHCRFVLEHQSSSLGNVIEFPRSYTLLESKRNTQLLRSIVRQASANMTCVATNVCLFSRSHLSCSFFQANLNSFGINFWIFQDLTGPKKVKNLKTLKL